MQMVSFNLRHVWDEDGTNSFVHRAVGIYDKIIKEMPEVIMFQEMREGNLKVMERLLPEYKFYGHFRDADYMGEGVFTAVLDEKVQAIGMDSYWLSPTPYVPGSRFENQSECPRTCLSLKIRDKETNKVFRVLNTHLDHISDAARIEGIRLVLDRTYEDMQKEKLPTILGGDFNARPDSETIKYCNEYDKLKMYDVTDKIDATFHDFGKRAVKIDYIFVTEDVKNGVGDVYIWDECVNGIYLSDHYPVCMELNVNKI